MILSPKHIKRLNRVITMMQEVASWKPEENGRSVASTARKRRTGKELESFKKQIAAERKKGAAVSALAQKYGVTPSYIYQIPELKISRAPTAKRSASKKAPSSKTASKRTAATKAAFKKGSSKKAASPKAALKEAASRKVALKQKETEAQASGNHVNEAGAGAE